MAAKASRQPDTYQSTASIKFLFSLRWGCLLCAAPPAAAQGPLQWIIHIYISTTAFICLCHKSIFLFRCDPPPPEQQDRALRAEVTNIERCFLLCLSDLAMAREGFTEDRGSSTIADQAHPGRQAGVSHRLQGGFPGPAQD